MSQSAKLSLSEYMGRQEASEQEKSSQSDLEQLCVAE